MNLKIEPISQTQGFGNDFILARGYRHAIIEYHRSSGIQKSKGSGFAWQTLGVMTHLMDFTALTSAGATPSSLIFGQSKKVSDQAIGYYLMATSTSGDIIQSFQGFADNSTAEYVHRMLINNHAYFSHMIVDPKGRNLYMQDRYLGMNDPTNGLPNYIVGTVAVTNGSASVVGTGTTFAAGMVGKAIKIGTDKKFYQIATYVDATHITLTANYTGTTLSGLAYVINTQWNDSWKDFGAAVSLPGGLAPNCPMDIYEDTVLFGRANNLCTLNVVSDTITTDALPALNFPVGYMLDHIVSNSNGILLGLNTINGKGLVALWDNYSTRSIAPWIWFNDQVLSITKIEGGWIVTTSKGIYTTDGYTAKLIKTNFLESGVSAFIKNYPKNSIVIDNALFWGGVPYSASKRRAVVYKYDLGTNLVEAIPRTNLNQNLPQFLQFEYSTIANRLFCIVANVASAGVDFYSPFLAPVCSTFVSSVVGMGDNNKVANRIRLKIRKSNSTPSGYPDIFTFTLAAKITDNKRPMYGFQVVKTTSANKHTIVVDNSGGSFTTPQVGDEVEFPGDSWSDNNAGYSRHIKSITGQGTATETWTLESDFPSTPQANQSIILTPFKLIKRYAVSVTNGAMEPFLFSVNTSPKGRNFFVKIDVEDNTSGIPLEFDDIDFHYDDLGQM